MNSAIATGKVLSFESVYMQIEIRRYLP